ncbi:CAF17-like 4Fe-4S cluster assembly/insertion protein YgfZ [Neptunicoccus cionae]|uniref:Aminomethyltransferase n=1 Tax=Neptunicoccus cionae TaxID=2035344 RepID=A0A916QVA0_9RHOB|nr:folate-binding protein YgfZ [Amylibacter cionae]GGA12506.1 aminomethyltransferase [Amylibacter cionae]
MSEETRRVLRITGADRARFLNDLVTNDLKGLERGLVYAALLTPQGKYLFDFFLAADGESILLDVDAGRSDALVQRLTMYKLRADVGIADAELFVHRGVGEALEGALADPRHPSLGWRMYSQDAQDGDETDWDALRVAHCVPQTDIELIADGSFILECGFERLNGVDFRKGCYVGQEVTARMKHKTELRKGLATVNVDGTAPVGTELRCDGKAVGTLYTQSGGQGIAYLRFDRVKGDMQAGDATVTLREAG